MQAATALQFPEPVPVASGAGFDRFWVIGSSGLFLSRPHCPRAAVEPSVQVCVEVADTVFRQDQEHRPRALHPHLAELRVRDADIFSGGERGADTRPDAG